MEHTKGPWIGLVIIQPKDNGMEIAVCTVDDDVDEYTDHVNAAYIERCVNAHDSLVAAARDALELLEVLLSDEYVKSDIWEKPSTCEKLRAALALAEEEK